VLAIKLTLYRTGGDSSIAKLLQQAAERGKQVAVLIELQRASTRRTTSSGPSAWRTWRARELRGGGPQDPREGDAGGAAEGDFIRRYVHIGTGNYNPKTARQYTDFGILSCDPAIGADLTDLFNVLTGFGQPAQYRQVLVAPRTCWSGSWY
jgi:polyphosphate kinase